MSKTNIPWATDSINPIRTKDGGYHCTKVSEGCERCYAESINMRFGNHKPFDATPTEIILDEKPFEKLLAARKPKRVFLQSMGDIAHEDVPDWMLDAIFAWMAILQKHTFLVLTKRPERLRKYLTHADWGEEANAITHEFIRELDGPLYLMGEIVPPLPNVWIGVTCENQKRANERIPILLKIPAVVHFVSYEPALGPITIAPEWMGGYPESNYWAKYGPCSPRVDFWICGCETAPGARPMDEAWARSMKNQCVDSGVAFFLKAMMVNGKKVEMPELDGQVWDQIPSGGQDC